MTDRGSQEHSRVATAPTVGSGAFFFGQMLFIPFRMLLYGMEMLIDAMRGLQKVTDRGMKLIAGNATQQPAPPSPAELAAAQALTSDSSAPWRGVETITEETDSMDKDLNDDMLKLVRYKILFVKREFEHAFQEHEELVSDNMESSAYAAWKVAEFIQSLAKKETVIPGKWGTYPDQKSDGRHKYREEINGKWILTGLPEDDKKYLRVFYEVLERYPREKLKYEEDQLKVLREIRDKMPGGTKGVNVG